MIETAVRLGLGGLFVLAGVSKVVRAERLRATLILSGSVPSEFVAPVTFSLPWIEVLSGGLTMTGALDPLGPALLATLLVAFLSRTWRAATASVAVPCACFGTTGSYLDRGALGRNIILLAFSVIVLVTGRSNSVHGAVANSIDGGKDVFAFLLLLVSFCLVPFLIGEALSLRQASPRLRPSIKASSVPGD